MSATRGARFESLWEKIHSKLGALIIQNNFDLPRLRPLGNLEAAESFGRVNFLMRLNSRICELTHGNIRAFSLMIFTIFPRKWDWTIGTVTLIGTTFTWP